MCDIAETAAAPAVKCRKLLRGSFIAGPPSPIHSITSSARASSCGGTSRPSVFAVLRLITSSYLVGALDGQIGGLLTLEDAIDVPCRTTIRINCIRPVRD